MIFSFFSKAGMVERMLKTAPYLSVALAITALGYFGWSYLENMKASVKATNEQVSELKIQNESILQANIAIAEDMKGVKVLSETYNQKIIEIRTNTHTIANTVSKPEFKALVQEDPTKAQAVLNDTFDKFFNDINEGSK